MLELLAAGAALAGRALLQAADAAVTAVGEDEVRAAKPENPRRAAWLLALKRQPEPTAAALRGASSSLLAFAAVACAIVVGDVLFRAGVHSNSRSTLQLLAGLLAGAVALALDLAPRSLASASPMKWGLALSGPAYFVCLVLGGPVRLMLKIFDALLVRQGATARYTPPPPPLQEIEKILSDEARGGAPGAPAPELVHGLFSFAERTAKEIMVPRTRVIGVPIEASAHQIIDLLAEEGHTRMPVYEGDLDNIKGVLHAKDVIPLVAHPELIVLQDLVRPALFVPWTKPVGELLREMQQKRSLIALVVDEYGGLAGIVTLEDILEEIVGEIRDEHDTDAPAAQFGPDGTALVRAETRVGDLNQSLGAALPDGGDFETLGGLLNATAGAIPQTGDRFFIGGLELTVVQRDDRRARLVRIARPKTAPPPVKK
ncbi:MAG: CBS domain-containing protein [Deltaproteobacteria bacterium]|nr:MAG: CBS domain-containing protein [Deltaproteobacteria bacterium]